MLEFISYFVTGCIFLLISSYQLAVFPDFYASFSGRMRLSVSDDRLLQGVPSLARLLIFIGFP